ncbi:MAG TPA: tetratricopeptide repeat protein [Candidatus Angelobacter sp.]
MNLFRMSKGPPFRSQSGGINFGHSRARSRDIIGRDRIVNNIENFGSFASGKETTEALHNIPPLPGDYTGRESELAELLRDIKREKTNVAAMHGMGGVGKTTLALKLADQLIPEYPDGYFYVDSRGATKKPMATKDLMAHVVRCCDLRTKVPEHDAELVALYRSVLHKRRAILLVDNARDARHVEPLLPPNSCFLLVTSRKSLILPGAVARKLDALPHADACSLLLRIAPHLEKHAPELARLCGHLPLALRAVATALRTKVHINPADYVRRLADTCKCLKELTEVHACLHLSYELLPEGLQKRFCQLAVFTGTFDLAAAASVWGVDEEVAEDNLGELISYSLVEFHEGSRRYRLHDLVRVLADHRLDSNERETAHKAHAEHYLRIAHSSNTLYLEGGKSVLAGLMKFETEWANIHAAQGWASSNAHEDVVAAAFCIAYSQKATHCLSLRQNPRERLSWVSAALGAARKLQDRFAEGFALKDLGLAYHDLGQYPSALEHHLKHLHIARELGDHGAVGESLGNIGVAYGALSEHRRAIEHHEQHLQIAREMGDRRAEAKALGNLGLAYRALDELPLAIQFQEQRLQIDREIGDRLDESGALGNLGGIFHALGDYHHAIQLQEERLKIAREIGDRRGEGQALGNLGNAHYELGHYYGAIELQKQRLEIARDIGDRRGEAIALGRIGMSYFGLGEYQCAIEFQGQRLRIAREIGHRLGEAEALWNCALALETAGDRKSAIVCGEEALVIYEGIEARAAAEVRDRLAKWRKDEASGQLM